MKSFGYITFAIPRSIIFVIILCQVRHIKLPIFVIINRLASLLYFRISGIFLTRPTARKTRNEDPAQNSNVK